MPRIAQLDENGVVINVAVKPAAAPISEIELDDSDTTTWVGSVIANPNTINDNIRSALKTALALNNTFLAIPNPTNAQLAAQITRLTRECNGLIRIALGKLDSNDGT